MTQSIVDRNRLIVQGRLIEGQKPAEMTIAQWFDLYNRLVNDEELEGEQGRIANRLAQQLSAMQIATQMQSSTSANL